MRAALVILAIIGSASISHATAPVNMVIDDGISSGMTISLAGVSAAVMQEHLNIGGFGGNDRCEFKVVDYGSDDQVDGIWLASVFDSDKVPAGWSSFNAVTASGQNIKVATYADLSKVTPVRLSLELTCL